MESLVTQMKSIFQIFRKFRETITNPRLLAHKLNDYRNAIIIVLVWMVSSLLSSPENSFIRTISQVVRFILFPINLFVFHVDFSNAGFSSIYFVLIPLIVVLSVGFLYLISSED